MSLDQAHLVEAARELAEKLRRPDPQVKRSTFLSLVAGFLAGGSREELEETLKLVLVRSGGHHKRPGSFGVQAQTVATTLQAALRESSFGDPEWRSTLGWVGRQLEIHEKGTGEGSRRGKGGLSGRGSDSGRGQEPNPRPSKGQGLGALSGQSLEALQELADKLKSKDPAE